MPLFFLLLAFGTAHAWAQGTGAPGTPFYTEASIANTAANVADFFATNTFVTIYGQNLSYVVKSITPDDIHANTLPTALGTTGVRVVINNTPADMYFVSPGQVNALIPTSMGIGPALIQVVNNGAVGPSIPITIGVAAPALFQVDSTVVIATHGNGPLVTRDSPAKRGEIVVLYATGLGATAAGGPSSNSPGDRSSREHQ